MNIKSASFCILLAKSLNRFIVRVGITTLPERGLFSSRTPKRRRGISLELVEKGKNGKLKLIHIELPANYEREHVNLVGDPMPNGAAHLAVLLNI